MRYTSSHDLPCGSLHYRSPRPNTAQVVNEIDVKKNSILEKERETDKNVHEVALKGVILHGERELPFRCRLNEWRRVLDVRLSE